jgi:hypothetical protein
LLFAVLVRLPFWVEALRTPIDGDTAIVGLMARHPFRSAALWGQPYGSPVEAWAAIPFLAVLGPRAVALRLFYFTLGLGLVPAAYVLGGALSRRAALPAAFLMACPSPYFLLLASTPPPLYPITLLACAALIVLTLRLDGRLASGGGAEGSLASWGGLAGLALWTHLMAASVVAGCAAFLVLRSRGRLARLWPALVLLAAFSAPWWTGVFRDGWALHVVAVSNRDEGMPEHLREVIPILHRPVLGLIGDHVPLVADDPEAVVAAPPWASVALVLVYGIGLAMSIRLSRLRGAPGLLLGVVALALFAFPFPLRADAHTIRYLTACYLPLVCLLAWAFVGESDDPTRQRRGWIAVLALGALHLVVGARLLATWRAADRSRPPFLAVDLAPVREILEARHIGRAYASYDLAYRLTFESGERIIASEPWNERFRHYPLPYLDEVRFAKNVAWIFAPVASGDLPTARVFEDQLNAIGGRWQRSQVGNIRIDHGFEPPFGPTVEPLASAGLAGDGDLATRLEPSPSEPTILLVTPPRRLDALCLVAALDGPALARSLDVQVSADGTTFETVASRRRREERHDLRWVGGQPQYVVDHDLLAVPLGGRLVAAIRLCPFSSTEPWAIGEVLLHPAVEPGRRLPWDEWLNPGLTWPERREALAKNPRRDREDWYYRVQLAGRAR